MIFWIVMISSFCFARLSAFVRPEVLRWKGQSVLSPVSGLSGFNLRVRANAKGSRHNSTLAAPLTRTAIHRMRKPELAEQLLLRNKDTNGLKKDLVRRLLNAMREDEYTDTTSKLDFFPNKRRLDVSPKIDLQQVNPSHTHTLKIKGLSSMNSNGTGVGIVLVDCQDDRDVCTARKVLLGDRSVFEAEYSAIIIGLKFAHGRGVQKIVLKTENHAIANHLNGTFEVKRENLKPMYWSIMLMKEEVFQEFDVQYVIPQENLEANELAAKGLATRTSNIVDDLSDPMESIERSGAAVRRQAPPVDPAAPLAPMNYGKLSIEASKVYELQVDGGSRGNPGNAGAGMVLFDSGTEIWCGWKFLGPMSNNAAEYNGLLVGVQCAKSLGVKKIRIKADSDLIVKQVNGQYRVKNEALQVYHKQVMSILRDFDYYEIQHFRREFNHRADWLANHAMNTESSYGCDELE